MRKRMFPSCRIFQMGWRYREEAGWVATRLAGEEASSSLYEAEES